MTEESNPVVRRRSKYKNIHAGILTTHKGKVKPGESVMLLAEEAKHYMKFLERQ